MNGGIKREIRGKIRSPGNFNGKLAGKLTVPDKQKSNSLRENIRSQRMEKF